MGERFERNGLSSDESSRRRSRFVAAGKSQDRLAAIGQKLAERLSHAAGTGNRDGNHVRNRTFSLRNIRTAMRKARAA